MENIKCSVAECGKAAEGLPRLCIPKTVASEKMLRVILNLPMCEPHIMEFPKERLLNPIFKEHLDNQAKAKQLSAPDYSLAFMQLGKFDD